MTILVATSYLTDKMKNMKKFKINLKFTFIYKLLSSLFCSIGLLFQVSQLLTQYFGNKTVVNIEVKRELYENLPAITVCFPRILSIQSIAKYDQQHQENYEHYQQLMKTYYVNSTLYDKSKNNINSAYDKTNQIINQILYEPNFINLVMDNLSIPYSQDHQGMIIDGTFPGMNTAFSYFILVILVNH